MVTISKQCLNIFKDETVCWCREVCSSTTAAGGGSGRTVWLHDLVGDQVLGVGLTTDTDTGDRPKEKVLGVGLTTDTDTGDRPKEKVLGGRPDNRHRHWR